MKVVELLAVMYWQLYTGGYWRYWWLLNADGDDGVLRQMYLIASVGDAGVIFDSQRG